LRESLVLILLFNFFRRFVRWHKERRSLGSIISFSSLQL
jgi:hypothetical protein